MSPAQALALFGVGFAAGGINTIVGSGTLLTFPTLLAFGYPPVIANVTNTVGLVPGSVSGIHGYRQEVAEFRSSGGAGRLLRLAVSSLFGAIVGALLLLVLPAGAFKAIVPVLILTALVLVVVQPRLSKRLAARRAAAEPSADGDSEAARKGSWVVLAAVFGSGVYGGYFGAAQGVLLMAILGLTYADRLQVLNGVKNVLAAVVNGVAAVVFIIAGAFPGNGPDHPSVVWSAAVAIALGAIAGGQLGARIGRRLPPTVLRALIIVVGLVAVVRMLA